MRKITLFILLLLISLIGAYFYRPFIYTSGYFDMYIADTFPNLFAVPTIISFASIFLKKNKIDKKMIFFVFIGVILYEFLQLITGGFDLKDIAATIIGAILTLYFWNKYLKTNETSEKNI